MDSNEEVDDGSALFQKRSSDFLSWFTTRSGTRLSTKITLADLRYRGAGRGVRKHSRTSFTPRLSLMSIPQSQMPISRQMKNSLRYQQRWFSRPPALNFTPKFQIYLVALVLGTRLSSSSYTSTFVTISLLGFSISSFFLPASTP